jgi:ribose 5-phosphate isomerase A
VTIYERALELVPDGTVIGLGSGRAAWAFVGLLGERVQSGHLSVRGVACSEETVRVAEAHGVPLVDLGEAGELALTVDGADEVDPELNLIKGYGRALVREKIVAASSRQLVILVGEEKLVPSLGTRGRLPVEVVPFAVPLCERRLGKLGLRPVLWQDSGRPGVTDNGNQILDCEIDPIPDAAELESAIRAIPGVVGTGLFVGMADIVLVGSSSDFRLIEERRRGGRRVPWPPPQVSMEGHP